MKHLSDHCLEEYHLGMIPDGTRFVAIEEHLLSCPACAARAEQSAQYVDAMRSAATMLDQHALETALGAAKRYRRPANVRSVKCQYR